jgi:CheY-like chemotaxis protein
MPEFKVLIVEDDPTYQDFLKQDIKDALSQIGVTGGYFLKSVGNLSEAVQALELASQVGSPWNLLIADIRLPPQPNSIAKIEHGKILVEKAYRLGVQTIIVSGECSPQEVRFFLRSERVLDFFSKNEYLDHIKEFYQHIQTIFRLTDQEKKKQQELSRQKDKVQFNAYKDFQLLVTEDRKIRASSEQGEQWSNFLLDIDKINLVLQLVEERKTKTGLLEGLGRELYQSIFPADILGQLRATMASANTARSGVRLRLLFKSPEIAALPWEFLYDKGTSNFLANDIQTILSRYVDVPLPPNEIKAASLPFKILLVIASPTDLPQLDAAGEEQLIRDALSKHINEETIELDVLDQATIRNINQKLREKRYNVLHFIGHGVFKNDKGFIALVDEDGKAKLLDDESFANFFLGNRNLGLVVLNSCQGAEVSSNQIFAGIAPNLVRRGIPAVVAMQYSILDSTAKLFADEFYRTLALGWPVDAAIQTTRNAISLEVGLDKRDFATPVLYMRAKDGVILEGL